MMRAFMDQDELLSTETARVLCHEVENLPPLLNAFAENDGLPKMILYSLNPNNNAAAASIMGCFQNGCGRLRQGSARWFNDSCTGMRTRLTELANLGICQRIFPF